MQSKIIGNLSLALGIRPELLGAAVILLFFVILLLLVRRFGEALLPVARVIDKFSEKLGVTANWLVLIACIVSAGNATVRYLFAPIRALTQNPDYAYLHPTLKSLEPLMASYGDHANGFLEAQWYMFAGMVLLGAAYTMRVNEHVRVDLFYGAVTDRTRHWIDLLGGIFFLMPMCLILIWFTWPWFLDSWRINEGSTNAGGLVRWPVKLLMPAGFVFLLLQGFSEIIKRAAALKGVYTHEFAYEKPLQ